MSSRILVALGDSLTYGFPYTPEDSWVEDLRRATGWKVINSGVSGDTFSDMMKRLERDVLQYEPQDVILMGGTNDVYQGFSQPQIQQDFLAIKNKLIENNIQVLVGLPLPVDDPVEKGLKLWRQWLVELCNRDNTPLIDFYRDFIHLDGAIRQELLLDGCHPRLQGYRVMGERCIITLRKIGLI